MNNIYISLNVFAIIIILIILASQYYRVSIKTLDNKLFTILMILTIIFLALDGLYLHFIGRIGNYITFVRVIKCFYYIINITISFVWCVYIDYKIFNNIQRLKKVTKYYAIILVIGLLMSVLNIFFDVFFTISDSGVFVASSIPMIIYTSLSYIYIIYTMVLIFKYRKKITKRNFVPFISFAIPPVIFMGIQLLLVATKTLSTVSLISSYVFSEIIIYINVQNDLANVDSLTGIRNRRTLAEYFNSDFKKRHFPLGGIMIDLDGLKSINDTYGHLIGDKALQAVGQILSESIDFDDFLVRYAGDEFIILTRKNKDEIEMLFDKIDATCEKYNDGNHLPCKIEFSKGYYISAIGSIESMDSFLQKVDKAMYTVKKSKQNKLK